MILQVHVNRLRENKSGRRGIVLLASNTSVSPYSGHGGLRLVWVKVKLSRYRPGVAQRVGRGIALLFYDRGTRRG